MLEVLWNGTTVLSMDRRIKALNAVARLAQNAAKAAAAGDIETSLRLQREMDEQMEDARRLARQAMPRPQIKRGPSARDRAVQVLTELDVPSSPKEIAAYAEARAGEPFIVTTLATIRRDEQRSWKSESKRDIYIVPALEGQWFVAGRGRFALSVWPLWKRIVGDLSLRADHLRLCLRLADLIESMPEDKDANQRLRRLLARYVRAVPGALEQAWTTGDEMSLDRVREAVHKEFGLVDEEDTRRRHADAERAMRLLDEDQQMWGGQMPAAVGDRMA
jgi:hypothetical protein